MRKLIRNIRNVFTNELEEELIVLSREYFRVRDELEDLKEKINEVIQKP